MKNDLNAEQLRQEVTVALPLSVILRITEQQAVAAAPVRAGTLPAIGSTYGGGIYAGLSVDGEQPVALVLLPDEESLPWNDAVAWAEKQGGALPSRIDQLVLFKNLKAEFKEAWYWSGEQYAGCSVYAWYQYFGDGYQNNGLKDDECRARAVRRLPIQ